MFYVFFILISEIIHRSLMLVAILGFLSHYVGKFVTKFSNIEFGGDTHLFFVIELWFLRTIKLLRRFQTLNFTSEFGILALIHLIVLVQLIYMVLHYLDIIINLLQTITFGQKFICFWVELSISFSSLAMWKIKLEIEVSYLILCLSQLVLNCSHLAIICPFSSHCVVKLLSLAIIGGQLVSERFVLLLKLDDSLMLPICLIFSFFLFKG